MLLDVEARRKTRRRTLVRGGFRSGVAGLDELRQSPIEFIGALQHREMPGMRYALRIEHGQNILGEFNDTPLLPVASGFPVSGEIESDQSETI